MNELQKTYSILNELEELNKSKFNFSNFVSLNKEFETTLDNIVEHRKFQSSKDLTSNDKKNIYDLISKIEFLEAKIFPKADLMNSFSKSIK
jgi:hypothetical protein